MYRPNGSGRDIYLMGKLGPRVHANRSGGAPPAKLEQRHSPPARFYPSGSGRDLYLSNGKGRYWDSKGKEYSGIKSSLGSAIFTESIFNTPKRNRPMSPREKEQRDGRKSQQDKYMRKLSATKRRPQTAAGPGGRVRFGQGRGSQLKGDDSNDKNAPYVKGQKKPLVFRGAYFTHRVGGMKFNGKASHSTKWH